MPDRANSDDPEPHDFELDDPLLRPPDATVEPSIDPQLEHLPFEDLSWENFERLLLRVAKDVEGLRNVQLFGARGQRQKGLDVIGINSDTKVEGIQSKRKKTFTTTDLDVAVKKYTDATFPFPFSRLVIGVSKQVADREIVEHLIGLNVSLAPLVIVLWDRDELSRMLRSHPQIVTEFFGAGWATRFCCEHKVIAVEIAGTDAVGTADAVMRGPLTTVGGYDKLKTADEIAEDEPGEALALYRDVQQRLSEAGFPGHAAEFDERVAHLLVATGSDDEAVALIMDRLWIAERADDWISAQAAARTLRSLAGLPEFGPAKSGAGSSPILVAAARVAGFVADRLHQPVPVKMDLPVEEFKQLLPRDRAQAVLFAAERALSDDAVDWLEQHIELLSDSASEVNTSHEDVALRLELTVAEVTGEWNALLHRARTSTRRDLGALILARYARYVMWRGDHDGANQSWAEAINNACLAHRHEDATNWLYSQRLVINRHVPVFEDQWHPLARSLSNLPSRPRLVTSTCSSRENALATLRRDEKRSAAIYLRRYLCDAIRSGSVAEEMDARTLLGGVYAETNQPALAARQMILSHDYKAARSLASSLGDSYLDVSDLIGSPVSWVVASAFEFVSAEADLIPDESVSTLIDAALSAIEAVNSGARADSPVYSPQISRSAYRLIGALSKRLSDEYAAVVLESLSDHVEAKEFHYWTTDESHSAIAAGIAMSNSDEIVAQALDHLIGLYARDAHPFDLDAQEALRKNFPAVQARVQKLADDGHHYAPALLALADEENVDPEKARAAAERLKKPTSNSSGHYGVGTCAVNDSLLARSLPPAERAACIDMLLQNARSPFEGTSNRQTYLLAAANLSEGLSAEQREHYLANIVDYAGSPPRSEPDFLNASMTNPLGGMRWEGNLDSRPAAVLSAAFFAESTAEKAQVRDLAVQLIGVAGEHDHYLARALRRIGTGLDDIASLLAQGGWAMRSVAAITWAKFSSLPFELGERLSRDPDPRVRRALAGAIKEYPSSHTEQIRGALQSDPRWSVRSILI